MEVRIIGKGKRASEEDLRCLETRIGANLPEDYRLFLKEYNGGKPEDNEFSIPGHNNDCGVSEFLGVAEILPEKEMRGKRLVDSAFPIAYAECGNLVCIKLDEGEGKVFFWDHELEDEEENLPSMKNMFLLSESFGEFLESLKKFDPSTVELKPGQVKRVWVDPSFLEEIERDRRGEKPRN